MVQKAQGNQPGADRRAVLAINRPQKSAEELPTDAPEPASGVAADRVPAETSKSRRFSRRLGPKNEDAASADSASLSDGATKLEEERSFSMRPYLAVAWTGLVLWWLVSSQIFYWLPYLIIGLVSSLLFVRNPRPMTFVRICRDWLGVALWVVCYGASRSAADTLGMPVQEQILIDIDRLLGFGEQPVHRLQQLIDWDQPPRLWEASLSAMYISHFLVAFGVLIVMYNRDRVAWGQWWRRLVLTGSIGLLGFVLLPSAPPWMSSDTGAIEMVYEGLPRGWDAVQIEWIHQLFEFGRNKANPIAAMPSLHAAYPALLFLFWGPRNGRVVRTLLAVYALFMGFTIVITGQHWLIDVFAGWLVAYVAHRSMSRIEVWNARRKAEAVRSETEPSSSRDISDQVLGEVSAI